MKKLIFLSIVFLPALLAAQRVVVSDEISIRDDVSYYLLDDRRGNLLFFHDLGTRFEVQGLDEHLRQQWEKDIELDKKRPEIVDVTSVGGDFCVLYTFRDRGKTILKAHRYNPGANLVDSVTIKNFGSVFHKPDFEVEYSQDGRIALLWSVEDHEKITAMAFHLGQMKLLWEREIIPDNFIYARDFSQLLVDNNGNMYLVLEKANRRARQKEHHLEILECRGEEAGQLKRYTVDMQGHLTYDVLFKFDNLNRSLVAGGLYGDDNTASANGLFFLSIAHDNPNQQVLKFHPFEKDFVNILLEKNRNKNKGLTEVKVQEIVLRRDGGILLVGELAKEFVRGGSTSAYQGRTGIRPIVDYYYDDLFLVSLHPDGALHWKNILHKKQYSQDDAAVYSSYFLVKTPSALRFVFNDEVKYQNTVSEYIVRGNGEYDRNAVMNTEQKDLSIRFRDGVQISAHSFIAPSERRHKVKVVKVEFAPPGEGGWGVETGN
ncbi:MAG TPA: hypothetical protein ENJ20_03435 [Bacteroidetes bacterium]|nr:hypothetical protein [Bacteroidota bacterium]